MRVAEPVRIATRSSALALAQARLVQQSLAAMGRESELVTYTTIGDRVLDRPLSAIGAKGLFTRELEDDLRAGRVSCAVHSLKDLPTEDAEGLVVAAFLPREDPRDALVVAPLVRARSLAELPAGARVGTSSLRRRAQLLAARPDLTVVELRGNVPTRLGKVERREVDAAILAAAGLHRLGCADRVTAYLDAPAWLPAAGQGAVAVQVRADDDAMRDVAARLTHAPTAVAVRAERALLGALEGGCQVPIGALAVLDPARPTLHAFVADVQGVRFRRAELPLDPDAPERSGERLAALLRADGGDAILADLRHVRRAPAPQPE